MIKYEDIQNLCYKIENNDYMSAEGKVATSEKVLETMNAIINLNVAIIRNNDIIKNLEQEIKLGIPNSTASYQLDNYYEAIDEKCAIALQRFEEMNEIFSMHNLEPRFEIFEIDNTENILAQTMSLTEEMRFHGLDNYVRHKIMLKDSMRNDDLVTREANGALFQTNKLVEETINRIISKIDINEDVTVPKRYTAMGEALKAAGISAKDFEDEDIKEKPVDLEK